MRTRLNMFDEAKKEAKRVAVNINSDANSAFRAKKGEIEEMPLFRKYSEKLTPEEIARAQSIGLLIGGVGALVVIIGIGVAIWWWFV